MKHLPRWLIAGLVAIACSATAQVNINAPAAPRPVTAGDKVLVKLDGDSRAYLLPISGLTSPVLPAFTGDCSTVVGGAAITCTKSNGVAFGAAAFRAVGTTSGTVAAGNDARLSDARTPLDGSVTLAKLGSDITAAGKDLLDDLDAAAQRATLGLGNAATLSIGTGAGTVAAGNDARFTDQRVPTDGSVTLAKLGGDITAAGRAILDDLDAAAQRLTLGLGTAATQPSTAFEAAGGIASHAALTSGVHGISTYGAQLVAEASAAAARTRLGLIIGSDVQAYSANTTLLGNTTTGSGSIVRGTSPILTTPNIGAATATTVNNVSFTPVASTATLAMGSGKTLSVPNTLTLSGTDGSTLAIGTGGTLGTMAYASTSAYVTTGSATTALAGKLGNVETGASTTLALGAIADGQYIRRSGSSLVGDSNGIVSEYALGSLPSASANNGLTIVITGLGNRKVLAQSNGTRWLPYNGRQLINSVTPYATVTGATTELAFTGNSYTSPIGFLGANDSLVIRPVVSWSATTGSNTMRAKISGTDLFTPGALGSRTIRPEIEIFNDNSTSAQWVPLHLANAIGSSTQAPATFSINTTTTAITVDFYSQAGDAATVATLRAVDVYWVTR